MGKALFFLLTFLSSHWVMAQEPTVNETIEYIKLKTSNAKLWYNNSSLVESRSCADQFSNYISDISSISFQNKQLTYSSNCEGGKGSVTIFLEKVKSVEVIDDNVVLTSAEPLLFVEFGNKSVNPVTPTRVKFIRVENPEKLLKAFNHFFKLSNIKLLDDKF